MSVNDKICNEYREGEFNNFCTKCGWIKAYHKV